MRVADTSLEAYQRTNADLWREKVLGWLAERGGEGTLWQAAEISARPRTHSPAGLRNCRKPG